MRGMQIGHHQMRQRPLPQRARPQRPHQQPSRLAPGLQDYSDDDGPIQSLHQMHRAPKLDSEDLPDDCVLSENRGRKHHNKPRIGFSPPALGRSNEQRQKEESDLEELKRGSQSPPDDYDFNEYDY